MKRPRIFVSYRREDVAHAAGRLAVSLEERDVGAVFVDVSIGLGQNFAQRIREEIAASDVVLVLIGRNWLGAAGDGNRRIDSERDWVHLEVRTALERDLLVVPVLIDGASMPEPENLPVSLRDLVNLQAGSVSATHWDRDVNWLAKQLATLGSTLSTASSPTGKARDDCPAGGPEDVVVVAARSAYGEYLEGSAYVCQPRRSFRPTVRRMGFYFDRLLRREFPEVLHVRDDVSWKREEARALREQSDPFDCEVADLIERSYSQKSVWFGQRPNERYDHFKVFLLSPPRDARTLVLPEPLFHEGASAFTMKQRYIDSERLPSAVGTNDL